VRSPAPTGGLGLPLWNPAAAPRERSRLRQSEHWASHPCRTNGEHHPSRCDRGRFVSVRTGGSAIIVQITVVQNNELERTRSTQHGLGPRRSIPCWTDRGTDRSAFVPPPPAVADAPSVLLLGNGPAWAALLRSFHQRRPSLGARPTILQHPVGQVSTWSLPSAPSWLGVNGETTDSGFPVVAPKWGAARPSNKGLERTRPAANGLTGPCRSTQCSTGLVVEPQRR